MFVGFVYLLFRFWFVPVGFVAAAVTAFALRRVLRRSRRARPNQPEIVLAPEPEKSDIDKKVEAELDALERPWRT